MTALTILCDIVGHCGGAERYWETVVPELARAHDVRLFGRDVRGEHSFGVRAEQIAWASDEQPASAQAAERVAHALDGGGTVITANVFDPLVLQAVRRKATRWIARIHDHRTFCPNGNKTFPQFRGVCGFAMGKACVVNSALRGCVCGPRPASFERIRNRMRGRDVLREAGTVLVSSSYMQALCVQNGISAARIRITPPPVADAFFAAHERPSARSVLFFGRVNEEKGIFSLIRALAALAPADRPPLAVAGECGDASGARATALALELGVKAEWLGWLSQSQLRGAIDESRVVALPSLWPEPFGLAGIQALARARPVVAYDVGGIAEWLDGGGTAVRRGDERALGAAIASLCGNEAHWRAACDAARRTAGRYRLDAHMETLRDVLDLQQDGIAS
ncbi:MAG: glycosyltransferase family 4 protein [Candidatus Baltobacteraceae bacterium]